VSDYNKQGDTTMTDSNKSMLAIVLDRSGSMSGLTTDTIGGFNTFLSEQKKLPGEALLTLVQFDHEFQIVHDCKPLPEVPDLTTATYVPRGNTALLDALGRTIVSVGERLAKLPEEQRPARVIVLVITDGQENASREYDRSRVAALIKQQREQYKWEFVFMGATEAAVSQGAQLGIDPGLTRKYVADPAGTRALYSNVSRGIGSFRSGEGYN
jgi:uncharacterized protein YegL